jgi:branched-chain amino acid transport system substrate-binding protein
MTLNLSHRRRRQFIFSSILLGAGVASTSARAQSGKGIRKIVIGQSVPLTGAAELLGVNYFNGAKMYFDAVNAKNGAAGYKIEVKVLDDGYDAAKAASNAKQLIAEGVDALFGFAGTASTDAVFPIAKAAGIVLFAPFAASSVLHGDAAGNVFHVRPALADEAFKVIRHCATLNLDRIAVFAEDDAMGRAGTTTIREALADLKRPPLVGHAVSPVNSDQVDAAVAQLVKLQPQAIVLVSLFTSSAAFIRKMRKAGYNGQFMNFSVVGIDPLFSALGKEIGGIVLSQVVPSPRSTTTPIVKEYLDVLNLTDQTPTYESVEGYIAARTFTEGVRRAAKAGGKVDRIGLQKAFEAMTDYDVGGFRINLRPKRYESVRLVDLVTVTPDGKIVR